MENLFQKNNRKNIIEKIDNRSITLILIFLIVCTVMYFINPDRFLTIENFKSMAVQMSETGVLALAFFIVIAVGGFNLSVIAVANLSAVCMGLISAGKILNNVLIVDSVKLILGIFVGLLVGILCGLLNAFFVRKLKLDSVLVTAATLQFFAGITMVITKGKSIVGAPEAFLEFAAGNVFKFIPNLFMVMLLCFIIVFVYFNNTKFGEQAKLLGYSEIVSKYSGIGNNKISYIAYALSGFFSAIGGIIIYSRMGIIKPDYGMESLGGTMFLVVLLGGAMILGGGGKIINIFLSLAILQAISSGLSLGNYTPFNKQFIWGILLLVVIIFTSAVSQNTMSKFRFRGLNRLKD